MDDELFFLAEPLLRPGFERKDMGEVRELWRSRIERAPGHESMPVSRLYVEMFEAYDLLLEREPATNLITSQVESPTIEHLYRFVLCVSSPQYLGKFGDLVRITGHEQLRSSHAGLTDRINAMIARPDVALTSSPPFRYSGWWRDIAVSAIELYSHHTKLGQPDFKELQSDAADLIEPLLRAFPDAESAIFPLLAKHHPNADVVLAKLVRLYYFERDSALETDSSNPLRMIARELLGPSAERTDFYRQHGAAIMEHVLIDAPDWSDEQLARLVDDSAIRPMGLLIGTEEEELERARQDIERLPIPSELLETVTSLTRHPSGSDSLNNIWPFWDPGAGDQLLPIAIGALEDLPLLPNLETIRGVNVGPIDEQVLVGLTEAGIQLVDLAG